MKMSDTSKEAQAVLVDLLRKMPIEKKIQQIFSAYTTGKSLAMAGIRERNPEASEKTIWYLWAQEHLGASLFEEVYGELPPLTDPQEISVLDQFTKILDQRDITYSNN